MTEWLFFGLHGVFVGRHGARPVKFRDADERRRYSQLHHLVQFTGECLLELVQLRRWQTTGGLTHQQVVIDPVLTDVDQPTVGPIWRREDPAHAGLWCELNLPLAWLDGPVDGIRGVQLYRAILLVLDAVGEQFGLGQMPVAKPPKKAFEADDPFRAHDDGRRREAIESATTWLSERVDSLERGRLIVASRGEASARRQSKRAQFVAALGDVVHSEERVLEDGKKVTLWVVHPNW